MSLSSAVSYKKSASRSNSPVPASTSPPISQGAKELQERLHLLLNRLAKTTELIKTWPESDGDDASIHVETTTKLINSIIELIKALQRVEGVIKTDADLKKTLQECQVPINLLDLLDHHPDGLNPECFSRGLLREALGQLGGLKRRKLALEMLGAAVQAGLDRKDACNNQGNATATTTGADSEENVQSNKRKIHQEEEENLKQSGFQQDGEGSLEPASKKAKTTTTEG
ncbi:hypothetical protein IV203_016793 [Nitzschia inconspicua]|uniref:Mediator complex subunit 10 n=1 Tax=Nitzschia inconspicua TaxID=303405 RepID=A0A9K3PHZ8_9STRA|nr:hypothetical protein IV203_016793 [Nitzschia inconspicua]